MKQKTRGSPPRTAGMGGAAQTQAIQNITEVVFPLLGDCRETTCRSR